VSPPITIASTSQPITYTLISGSGNGSLSQLTLTSATGTPPIDWTTTISRGATDVTPNIHLSSVTGISSARFWFDTNETNTTPPSTGYAGNAGFSNSEFTFYPTSSGFGTPIAMPPAPATSGIYYGKYAIYDSSNTILGVFTTNQITVT
jgi:hypothetical protein